MTLIIDNCCAFTGDLPSLSFAEAYNDPLIDESWRQIQEYQVKQIYPCHGDPYSIE